MQSVRWPTFETLEPRHALTAITATLDQGVLSIDAHDSSNTLTLSSAHRQIIIAQTSQSFDVSQVKKIDIQLHGATDIVLLNSKFMNSTGKMRIPIDVDSDGGDDEVFNDGGSHFYLGPDAQHLNINNKGTITIDGRAPNWFDTKIPDNDLGSLLRQETADGTLSRVDMLNVFNFVEQQPTVGTEDYTSLQTIVARTQLFKNVQYVQSLANLVVNASVANTYYQGSPLGNLSSSSTAAHLTLLVDKWFLGADHPNTDDLHDPVTWRDVAGTLFDGPPDMHQIHQGPDGDCFFLGGLESIATQNPRVIENMFIVNGDGTYTVRFYQGKQAVYLTIDSELPILNDGHFAYDDHNFAYNNPANILWSAFAEKAYAQLAELGWSRPDHTQNSYSSIDSGNAKDVMEQITGKPAEDHLIDATTANATAQAFLDGKPVVINSRDPSGAPDIVNGHAYAMVGYNRKTHEFELFNPWGFEPGAQHPALLWLTWQEITDHFSSTRVGSKV